jgi:hypothetical protein
MRRGESFFRGHIQIDGLRWLFPIANIQFGGRDLLRGCREFGNKQQWNHFAGLVHNFIGDD